MATASYRPNSVLCCALVGTTLACAEGEALDFVPDAHAPTVSGGALEGGGAGTSASSSGASGSGSGGGGAGDTNGSGGMASTAGSSGAGGLPGNTGSGGTASSGGGGGSGGGASGGGGKGGAASGGGGMGGGVVDASVGTGGSAGAPIVDASTEPPPACTTCKLKVQYQCRQDGAANIKEASFIVKVLNIGTLPIAVGSITLRYYYTVDTAAAQEADCDFAMVGCGNVSFGFKTVTPAKPKADRYLEVSLSGTGSIPAGADSGEIQIRMHDPAYQASYTQTNDYSFASTGAIYVDAPTIPAYSGMANVWGTEP